MKIEEDLNSSDGDKTCELYVSPSIFFLEGVTQIIFLTLSPHLLKNQFGIM